MVCSRWASVLCNIYVAEVWSAQPFLFFSSHLHFISLFSRLWWVKESRILTTSDAHKCPKHLVYQSGTWPLMDGEKNNEESISNTAHIFLFKYRRSWFNTWLWNLYITAYLLSSALLIHRFALKWICCSEQKLNWSFVRIWSASLIDLTLTCTCIQINTPSR